MTSRTTARWFKRIGIGLLVLLLALFASLWWLLRGSLPQLDGELALAGLSAPVSIQRDRLGVVTIEAANESDAMRALGFVHAQERYFEMDLLRRTAAGELAGLFGPVAVDTDKRHRVHRIRARVDAQLDTIVGDKRAVLAAYVDGVNAGVSALQVRPWPYLLLRAQPKPWQATDSLLTGYAMYFDLQDASNARELALWKLQPHLPAPLYALLTHDGSSWDAPLLGAVHGDATLPGAELVDLRKLPASTQQGAFKLPDNKEIGSNNFAVAGTLTRDGRAIVADDMHLSLRAPNIWFRAQLRYADPQAPGGRVDAGGFTLPGMPAVVVGSNRNIAWAFTNSYADTADWAWSAGCGKTPCPDERVHDEPIRVAGAAPVAFRVRETAWGPVLHDNPDGSRLALRWAGQLPGAVKLAFTSLIQAASVTDAFRIADASSIPAQNFVVGDTSGRIGWRILGGLPQRSGACQADEIANAPSLRPNQATPMPVAVVAPCSAWGLDSTAAVTVLDPESGRLWTANNRIVDGEALRRVGDGGYSLGARAQQIRDGLYAKERFAEADLLAIQLDDRALFLQRWWQLLRDEAAQTRSPALRELAGAAQTWQGRASADSVSYRLVRAWRLAVHERLANGLTAPAQVAMGAAFELPSLPQFEGVAWPLVTQRPAHLLPRRFASWEALFEDAAQQVRDELQAQGPLSARTWGERNTARICHPLAMALPAFAKPALCMPSEPLPGDSGMPRVQGPDMGASERMVVAPGHEADGIIHMPGGQSGHPLSKFWGAGHDDWVQGRPTPFLPGETRHALRMAPAR